MIKAKYNTNYQTENMELVNEPVNGTKSHGLMEVFHQQQGQGNHVFL